MEVQRVHRREARREREREREKLPQSYDLPPVCRAAFPWPSQHQHWSRMSQSQNPAEHSRGWTERRDCHEALRRVLRVCYVLWQRLIVFQTRHVYREMPCTVGIAVNSEEVPQFRESNVFTYLWTPLIENYLYIQNLSKLLQINLREEISKHVK